jgi:UDP-N-acetylglucosamine transferase subunit ALG13
MKILFAVQDWGLGHATRSLVLIRALLDEGHAVTVLSTGPALRLLCSELGERCGYTELRDIPKPVSRRAFWFQTRMALSLPQIFLTLRRERAFVQRLWERERFERIVSDSRFGVWLPQVPSYFLTHSLRQIVPGRSRWLETLVEHSQRKLLAGGRKILVPDVEANGGLAGDLCHDVACDWGTGRVEYLGILSSLQRRRTPQDIDCFISVSGPEPQRTLFERIVLEQAPQLPGRVVIALGRAGAPNSTLEGGRIRIHGYLDRAHQEDTMNRARLVVSRSGYTTLMELAELGRRALLVPTPGQTEQQYLARHHEARGHLHAVAQHRLRLRDDVTRAFTYRGLPAVTPTARSVQRFLDLVVG